MFFLKYQSQRGQYRRECNMIKHAVAGLLFFDVGRELRVETYDLCSTGTWCTQTNSVCFR
jgi:hypothetical protein